MKKLLVIGLILLSGCASKPKKYVCFNPFMPIQSFEIDTDHPRVKETVNTLRLTTDSGGMLIVPKSLCVEVREAN